MVNREYKYISDQDSLDLQYSTLKDALTTISKAIKRYGENATIELDQTDPYRDRESIVVCYKRLETEKEY